MVAALTKAKDRHFANFSQFLKCFNLKCYLRVYCLYVGMFVCVRRVYGQL